MTDDLKPFAPLSSADFVRRMIARGGGSRCCTCRTRKARETIPLPIGGAAELAAGVCSAACGYLLGRWAARALWLFLKDEPEVEQIDDRTYDQIAARLRMVPR